MARRADNTDAIRLWRSRISRSEILLRAEQMRWQDTLKAYRGVFFPDEDETGGIALVHAIIAKAIPKLYHRDPDLQVFPTIDDPAVMEAAEAIKAELQQDFRRLKVGKASRRIILDTYLFNRGWGKVGYQAEFETKTQGKEQIGAGLPAFSETVTMADRKAAIAELKVVSSDISFDDRLVSEKMFFHRINPKYVLHDADAPDAESCRFMIHKVPKLISDLRNSKIYRSDVVAMMEPDISPEEMFTETVDYPPSNSAKMNMEHHDGWTYLYEIWDRQEGEVLVLGSQGDDYVRDTMDWPYEMDGFPLFSLQFNEDPNRFWGKPDVELWLPQIKELCLYRKKRISRVKGNVSKFIINDDVTDEDTIASLDSPTESAVVVLKGDRNANVSVQRLDPATTPQDVVQGEAVAMEMLTNISGQSQARRGVEEPHVTATAASVVETAARDFEADRLLLVSEFQSEVADRLLRLDRQFKGTEDIISEIGGAGYNFYTVTSRMRKFTWDVRIMVGSSQFVSDGELAQRLMGFTELAAGFPGTDVLYILRHIARLLNLPGPNQMILDPSDEANALRLAKISAARDVIGIQLTQGGPSAAQQPSGGLAGAVAGGQEQGGSPEAGRKAPQEQAQEAEGGGG